MKKHTRKKKQDPIKESFDAVMRDSARKVAKNAILEVMRRKPAVLTPPSEKSPSLEYGYENLKKLSRKELMTQVFLCHHRMGVLEMRERDARSKLDSLHRRCSQMRASFRSQAAHAEENAQTTKDGRYRIALSTKASVLGLVADYLEPLSTNPDNQVKASTPMEEVCRASESNIIGRE